MNLTLRLRGPDSDGFYEEPNLCLGHRRLAIIDLTEGGHQPMNDNSDKFVITFNGEIYNFQELTDELKKLGHTFKSASDTEVIIEAYKEWGKECLVRMNGMFAFALWDKQKKELFLARDRVGKKPFFYYHSGENFLFASELKALLASGMLPKVLDPIAVRQYLNYGYVLSERSIIEGVRKVEPGHYLVVKDGRVVESASYWDLLKAFNSKTSRKESSLKEELVALIDDATKIRMISDVPLGAFLSGGIDSATVVASMNQATTHPVQSYSIGFKEKSFSEVDQARATAGFLKTKHDDKIVDLEFVSYLDRIVAALDEPLADNSIVPMFFLSEFARKNVTVALTGDGGDELFLGYETYIADLMKSKMMPINGIWSFVDMVSSLLPVSHAKVSLDFKLKKFLKAKKLNVLQAHNSWRYYFYPDELEAIIKDSYKVKMNTLDSFDDAKKFFSNTQDLPLLDRFSYFDIKTWMVDDVLMKCDRMSMAHSLELRSPLLDYRVVEFAASLPPSLKLKNTNLKYLLKKSQQGRIPSDVITQKKRGFNSPVAQWLKTGFGDEVRRISETSAVCEIIKLDHIKTLIDQHNRQEADNSYKLFNLIILNKWMETFLRT